MIEPEPPVVMEQEPLVVMEPLVDIFPQFLLPFLILSCNEGIDKKNELDAQNEFTEEESFISTNVVIDNLIIYLKKGWFHFVYGKLWRQ